MCNGALLHYWAPGMSSLALANHPVMAPTRQDEGQNGGEKGHLEGVKMRGKGAHLDEKDRRGRTTTTGCGGAGSPLEDRVRRVRRGRGVSLDVTTAREGARRGAPLVDQVPAFSPSRSREGDSIRRLRKLVEERERGGSRQVEEESAWPIRYVDSTRNISVDSGIDLVMDLRSQKQAARRLRQLRALNPLELLLKARTSLKLGLAGEALEQVVGRATILQLEVTSRMVRSMRAAKVLQAKGDWSSMTSRAGPRGGGEGGGLAQGRDPGSPGEEGGGTTILTTLTRRLWPYTTSWLRRARVPTGQRSLCR